MTAEQVEATNVVPLPEANWSERHPLEHKPQALDGDVTTDRANHLITISFTPNGSPMVVVRGDTAEEVKFLLDQLADNGVYANILAAQAEMKQQGPIGILGPVSAMSPEPPVAQPPAVAQGWAPQPPAPAAPAAWGAPAAPAGMPQAQWGQQQVPGGAPAGFSHRLNVPFPQKDNWKMFREQVLAPLGAGNTKWDGGSKTWLLSPRAVETLQARAGTQFGTPVPA